MIEQTEPYLIMQRALLLDEVKVWFDSFADSNFRRKILDLIREKQLRSEGVDEDGDIIGLYSRWTEILSGGEKKEGDPFTLFDTGEFYQSMFITVFRDYILIDADGDKGEDDLFEKYGEGIIGLTDENLQILIDELKDKYTNYARRILFNSR